MIFGKRFIAVGITDPEPGKNVGVAVYVAELGQLLLDENAARKLADDVLRNANYLWPVKDET